LTGGSSPHIFPSIRRAFSTSAYSFTCAGMTSTL
jgi:hypothetical protein